MRVRRIDTHVRPVGVVTENPVDEPHRAVVTAHAPLIGVRRASAATRRPAPSNASSAKTFFANSWTAYRPGDERLMRTLSGACRASGNVA